MSLTEELVLSRIRSMTRRDLRRWVREGWVRPIQRAEGPVFDEIDLARLRLIRDLRKDMGLSAQALPIVLGLVDQLHRTRRDLRTVLAALAAQPPEVRNAVAQEVRDGIGADS